MQMREARTVQRMPAYLGGKIRFNQDYCIMDCLIKNISPKGARITIDSVWDVPESFRLYIARHDKTIDCKIKWRTQGQIGVGFTAAA